MDDTFNFYFRQYPGAMHASMHGVDISPLGDFF